MRPVSLLLVSLALVVAVAGAPSLPGATLASASQGAGNAAGLVIADPEGGEPKTVCVRFSESSISGKQLLDRATQQRPDIDPVYARFGSRGHAVCALCGAGCDASDCFCQSRYWNYNVAHEGDWVRSPAGVDERTIEHGDIDGWAFGGDGAAPPYISFEAICGQRAQPTASPSSARSEPPPTAEPTPSTTPASQAPSPTMAPIPSADASADPTPRTSVSAPASPAATVAPTPALTPTPAPTPTATDPQAALDGGDEGAGPWGALVFLAVLGGLVALIVRRRG